MAAIVPTSEAEVFKEYYSHVKFLVSRAGIRKDYVEDYSMALMMKFVEKGVLEHYDPKRTTTVNGVERTANFKTFLSGFVNSYLRHFATRDAINARRSSLSSDMMLGDNKDIPLLDYLGMSEPDLTEDYEAEDLIARVRAALKKSQNEKMLLFFEIVLLQVEEQGRVNVSELVELFDVTRTTIHNWLKKLRQEFESCQ